MMSGFDNKSNLEQNLGYDKDSSNANEENMYVTYLNANNWYHIY